MSPKIAQARTLLHGAAHAVAFTGAGLSTASGIPDFRSPASGLWTKVDPMAVASIDGFKRNPNAFYDWIQPLMQTLNTAQPNAAHVALAELESAENLRAILTQNIDGLHTRAGSQSVYELHGHTRTMTCNECGGEYIAESLWQQVAETGRPPYCMWGHPLRPAVVLFGELLPEDAFTAAIQHSETCDVMLVAGSSLQTAPVGDLPLHAKRKGAKLIIVNREPTHVDKFADVVIHGDVIDVLPALV